MLRADRLIRMATLAGLTAGCTQTGNTPLIFVQTQSVGITVNTGATQTSPELTLGYRDVDAAIVPVTYSPGAGITAPLLGKAISKSPDLETHEALSVLGQFQVATQASAACIGLGKFFATGLAAKKLADGFAKNIEASGTGSSSCTGQAAASAPATPAAGK